jgi:CheY-like chemotaxis protein
VVLDLVMPEMDGFEFLDRFREEARHHRIPVIIWTSKDLTVAERESLGQRAHAVHRKLDGNLTSLVTDLGRFLPAPSSTPPAPLSEP